MTLSNKLDVMVTVITPNYNGEKFISRVVESVSRQNYSLEHIVIDDNSTDGSWELLVKLSKKYSWLKPVRLEKNYGPVVARNKAIELAKGKFLAFLDVDDLWQEDKLKTQIEFMTKKGCALSFSDYRFISEDGRNIGRRIKGFDKIGWSLHHITRYLGCLTIVINREIYPDFFIPEIYPATRAEDFLAWSQCIQKYGPALRCPYDLARYAVVPNSRSSSKKGVVSVWRLYYKIEQIPFYIALFYFILYVFFAFWKRYWYSPISNRSEIDCDFKYSILKQKKM